VERASDAAVQQLKAFVWAERCTVILSTLHSWHCRSHKYYHLQLEWNY